MIVNLDCVLLGKEVSRSLALGDDSAGTAAPAAQRDFTFCTGLPPRPPSISDEGHVSLQRMAAGVGTGFLAQRVEGVFPQWPPTRRLLKNQGDPTRERLPNRSGPGRAHPPAPSQPAFFPLTNQQPLPASLLTNHHAPRRIALGGVWEGGLNDGCINQ